MKLQLKKILHNDHRPKGRRLLEKLDSHQEEPDSILNNISEKEAGSLSKLLDKIRKAE